MGAREGFVNSGNGFVRQIGLSAKPAESTLRGSCNGAHIIDSRVCSGIEPNLSLLDHQIGQIPRPFMRRRIVGEPPNRDEVARCCFNESIRYCVAYEACGSAREWSDLDEPGAKAQTVLLAVDQEGIGIQISCPGRVASAPCPYVKDYEDCEQDPSGTLHLKPNAKADWDLGPQGRGAGLAACWKAPRSPVGPTKRDPFSDDRIYEFEQGITFG